MDTSAAIRNLVKLGTVAEQCKIHKGKRSAKTASLIRRHVAELRSIHVVGLQTIVYPHTIASMARVFEMPFVENVVKHAAPNRHVVQVMHV